MSLVDNKTLVNKMIFDRSRDCKKYSPYEHYKMKQQPSQLGSSGKFSVYTPKFEHGT